MYTLKELQPVPEIVATFVKNRSYGSMPAESAGAAPFYEYRAFEIRRLVVAGEYRHAVNVLRDSFATGPYSAACIWHVARNMIIRGEEDNFYDFKREIVAVLKELRITSKYKVGEESAITFMCGETTDATAAARSTVNRVLLKPMIAAYRAACAVTLTRHRPDLDRVKSLDALIEKVVTF
jgi:hypothetical protein